MIFPNPTSDFLNIKCHNNDYVENVVIYDLNGNVIFESNSSYLNLKHLSQGFYIINITSNFKNENFKIFKN